MLVRGLVVLVMDQVLVMEQVKEEVVVIIQHQLIQQKFQLLKPVQEHQMLM